jgi:protein-L-isoaspartate(D-aspartate) O-methyltransferase
MTYPESEDIAGMLRDIAAETRLTSTLTGKRHLDTRVMAAMARVERAEFLPEDSRHRAYANGPLPIGYGQTISQPFIVALMTDLLAPEETDRILEIGTGSGYQTAVLACLAKQVYSLEIVEALANTARARLDRLGYSNVVLRAQDGCAGWPEHAPYDGIIVTAAAPVLPAKLLAQLKPTGRLVIPVGPAHGAQTLRVYEQQADEIGRAHV